MKNARRIAPVLGAALALAIGLAGCGANGAPATTDGQPESHAPATGGDATGGDSSGLGSVTVTLDGAATSGWGSAFCTELTSNDAVLITSSTDDGGDLQLQTPVGGGTGATVILIAPGGTDELVNFDPGNVEVSGDTYTFTGTLADDAHSPTQQVQAEIVADCAG